jgi:hypothetical protein
MSFEMKSNRRQNGRTDNPEIRFGRTVETPDGRGVVAHIDWNNDTVNVQLNGAPLEERTVRISEDRRETFTFMTLAETVFPYDKVTPVQTVARTEDDLDLFLATHSRTGNVAHRVKPAARKSPAPRPISYENNDALTIGEVITVADKSNPQLFIAKAYSSKLIVVQDTVTGAVDFADAKTSIRTGANFLQLISA